MSKSLETLDLLKNNISDYLDTIQNNEETISKSEFMFVCIYPLYELIKKDLELLKEINKVWHDNEPMESVDINGEHLQELYDYINKLVKENQELLVNTNLAQGIALKYKKALDKACEKFDFIYHCLLDAINDLDYVCPITLNFIDELERENKCWKKYFLNLADVEVVKND